MKSDFKVAKPSIFVLFIAVVFSFHASINYAQVDFTSSNLPIVVIETFGFEIPPDHKITAVMGIIWNGSNERNFVTNNFNNYNGYIGIELHGSSSLKFPKKQFNIELRDSLGDEQNASLLGMPKESDWILHAPYSDKSLMRNVLIHKLGNDLGSYSPRTTFCEFILNGEYNGVYVLMEKVKWDKNRIDISKLRESDNSGDNLSGGYILRIDRNDQPGWHSDFEPFAGANQRIFYQFIYPKGNKITSEQKSYISGIIYEFENKMASASFNDPETGYYRHVNINSLVDYFLLNELAKNVDEFRLSTYLYKDRDSIDSRICFGPLWDFNIAFGNANFYNGSETISWQIKLHTNDNYQPPFWAAKLLSDSLFINKLSARWFNLRQNILSKDSIFSFINRTAQLLDEAKNRNFLKWPVIGQYVWPNAFTFNSYSEEVDYLKNWLDKRIDWIDKNLLKDYSVVEWKNPKDVIIKKEVNSDLLISKSEFYHDKKNIDNIYFLSLDDNLIIGNDNNHLVKFTSFAEGVFKFYAVGFYQGRAVELSDNFYVDSDNSTDIDEQPNPPADFNLLQNYPNPFNSTTKIKFALTSALSHWERAGVRVSLKVFDILGREITTLVNEQKQPGTYEVEFNASHLSSGIYFYKLTAGNFSSARKMLLLK